MIKFLILLLSLPLFAKDIFVSSYQVHCKDIFSDSKNEELIHAFTENNQEVRAYGSKVRDWQKTCGSNIEFDEIKLTTIAIKYSKDIVKAELENKLKHKVLYVGESLWSSKGLKDIEIIEGNGTISLQTGIDKISNVQLLVYVDHFIAAKALEKGTLIQPQDIKQEHIIEYRHFNENFPQDPTGFLLSESISLGSPISSKVLQQMIVDAGREITVLAESDSLTLEGRGVLTIKAKIGDLVKVKMKNAKIVEGILTKPDVVRVTIK